MLEKVLIGKRDPLPKFKKMGRELEKAKEEYLSQIGIIQSLQHKFKCG